METDGNERRVALVTGGAAGIGAAVAERLVSSGVRVVIADRDRDAGWATVSRLRAAGGEAEAHAVDVSDDAAVDALVDEIERDHGRLDCACNCAGVTGVRAPLAEYPTAVFRRVLEINTEGVFVCMRAELRVMSARGRGSIVNVASGAASLGVPGAAAYVASKHAVVGLTQTAAIEHAASGVRVNAVAPGLVRTAAVELDEQRFIAAHPSGRAVEAEEVASVVAWLLLDAPDALTGALLPVDGGLTATVPGV